jgi:uncharacterized protein (TIGR02217 family)
MTTTFIESQFPPDISYGSSGGSGFKTTIFATEGGWEQRNVDWSMSKAEYDVSQAIKNIDDMNTLIQFFMAVRGKAYGFRFKDWGDYQIVNQQIGVGDGTTTQFQLVKTYTDPNNIMTFTRTIAKPVAGSITTLLVAGVPVPTSGTGLHYSLDTTTGIFTFSAAPAATQPIVVSYIEFDVPVRFDTDKLNVKQEFWQTSSWESIKIVEIRL